MEKIGLLNEYAMASTATWEADDLQLKSDEFKKTQLSREYKLVVLKKICKERDIPLILGVEFLSLTEDKELRANSIEELNSLNAALTQLNDARQALEIVHDSQAYKAGAATYSTRQREAGLPLDAFREFIKSHTTRLTNKLSVSLPVAEKNLLRQRKENLKVAKEVYVSLQREALGLAPAPAKGIEIEM